MPVKNDNWYLHYHIGEIEDVAFQYQTDPTAIEPLLPDCYRLADKPTVIVAFGNNNQGDFIGGRGYKVASVQVAAS